VIGWLYEQVKRFVLDVSKMWQKTQRKERLSSEVVQGLDQVGCVSF